MKNNDQKMGIIWAPNKRAQLMPTWWGSHNFRGKYSPPSSNITNGFSCSPCKQPQDSLPSMVENCPSTSKCLRINVCRGPWGRRGSPPALNSVLHLIPNICLLFWRPHSTCRRSFHTCHKFFSRGDKLYDPATLLLSCASICAAPPLTPDTQFAVFVSLNIA